MSDTNSEDKQIQPNHLPPEQSQSQPQSTQSDKGQIDSLKGLLLKLSSEYSGLLPPPGYLREYDKIVPGAAERIIKSVEQQGDHRQFLERTAVTRDARRADWGLWVGFATAILFLIGSVTCILNGHDWAGGILGTSSIAAVVGVFIYGTSTRRSERDQKAILMRDVLKKGSAGNPELFGSNEKNDATVQEY